VHVGAMTVLQTGRFRLDKQGGLHRRGTGPSPAARPTAGTAPRPARSSGTTCHELLWGEICRGRWSQVVFPLFMGGGDWSATTRCQHGPGSSRQDCDNQQLPQC